MLCIVSEPDSLPVSDFSSDVPVQSDLLKTFAGLRLDLVSRLDEKN